MKTNNICKRVIFYGLAGLFFIHPVLAQKQEIDVLMKKMHQSGMFNGNVLVIQEGKTIYENSLGYTRGDKRLMLNSSYRFNIGSIGKEFNAVGIMMLKEEGKLSLDARVAEFLPELPAWAQKISVKNLLQYTSGLPDIKWQTIKSDADIMSDMMKVGTLNFEPGTNYAYNNSNVFLQRRIIERISGMPFNRFVEERMLKPCKMTFSAVDPDMSGEKVAVSFNNDFIESPRQFSYVMSGWTSVTAQDLYRWNDCLHSFKLISKASVLEILQPWSPGKQSGLGGGEIENGEIREHHHHGSSADFEALMHSDLKKDITVILLTNNMNFKVFAIKDAILNILDKKPYVLPRKSLLVVLRKSLDTETIDQTLKKYHDLKASAPDDLSFEEEELNGVGYFLMGRKRYEDAVKIMDLNVKQFPTANAYDSLGEAYMNAGNKTLSLLNYKKSLELDPKNEGARKAIEKLEKGN